MKSVAVSTTRHQFRVAQMLNLSMITFFIGLGGDQKYLVSLHHLFVCMAFLANLGVELLSKRHCLGLVPF